MIYIEKLYIEGFKKFHKFEIDFNPNMNIIVGENESGKSTILEAIQIVLNQDYKNADKTILRELFNVEMIKDFKKNPSIKSLPRILIEMKLHMDSKDNGAEYFYGENNTSKNLEYGISFECSFDIELGLSLIPTINSGKIPYEYYSFKWSTYCGLPYVSIRKPFESIFIDTSKGDKLNSFNYFNRSLFNSTYTDDAKLNAKNVFGNGLDELFNNLNLDKIDDKRSFGINNKKVILESILTIYENDIPLENKGSGMESLIKTQIALNKKSKLDVILIEEPENHLCSTNLNLMLNEIDNKKENAQVILTTHNNLIASRLNLNNVIWINNNNSYSLKNVNENTSKFFVKADGNSFLQMLLAKKIVFVEGATEYLLLPSIYKKTTGRTLEEDGIAIISCNGISYKRYLSIAKDLDKRIAVITDNDKKQTRIDDAKEYNQENDNIHIYMDDCTNNWTWEVCLYRLNKDLLDSKIEINPKKDYKFNGEEMESKVLGKMLNNKVEIAYMIETNNLEYNIPQYVKEAMEWVRK